MTKLRNPLSFESILNQFLNKLDQDDIKNITGKSISHFRKCSDPDDKEHNIHLDDALKIDILLQRKKLGTPFLDNFSLLLDQELRKINEFENISKTVFNIGGRLGSLMDIVSSAIDPAGPDGEYISKQEKDQIYKAILDLEEKIAKLKLSLK
jgi:hypothetical protein